MEGLSIRLAGLLATLRELAPDVPPGAWAWAVSLLGVGVGLLAALGAVIVSVVRKRTGPASGTGASLLFAGVGVVFAGLLPLVVFTATGRVFARVATGAAVPGLGRAALRELRADTGFVVGSQAEYLGRGSVAEAFGGGNPVWALYALLLLGITPVLVTVFVLIQARLALRRGRRWPAKFFWGPMLALPFLTAGQPAGTAGQLWVGMAAGAAVGIVAVAALGAPARRPTPAAPRREAPARPSRADRAAARFAAREPAPPLVVAPSSGSSPPTGPRAATPPATTQGYRPTLVATAPHGPAPTRPARFRLIRRLGSGGFGRVWLAQDAKLGHVVAVKAAHAPDPETEQRIRREARALAAVRHPHCVRVHDLVPARSDPGLADLDGMVLVMGYVEGVSLGDLVRTRGVLDDIAAARVWISLAGALDAAHSQGVMHRDVKPANVVVDQAGLAHLIDFGIARRTGDATMTQTGFVLGTPDFLAPEIACGQRATAESDAWQLAATISFALTGHPPRGGHPDAVSGLRAAAGGASLTHLPRRTAHLALLRAALDNEPGRRPPLPAVQRALEEWLRRAGAPTAGPVTAGARLR